MTANEVNEVVMSLNADIDARASNSMYPPHTWTMRSSGYYSVIFLDDLVVIWNEEDSDFDPEKETLEKYCKRKLRQYVKSINDYILKRIK